MERDIIEINYEHRACERRIQDAIDRLNALIGYAEQRGLTTVIAIDISENGHSVSATFTQAPTRAKDH